MQDTFSKCLKVGDATDEEDQRLIQGIIPDMVIDARGRINGGTFPEARLFRKNSHPMANTLS